MLTIIKENINTNTIILGDFNTPVTPVDRSSTHKINKEMQTLIDALDQMGIYKTVHPKAPEYTFLFF